MAQLQVPAIDQSVAQNWSEVDINLYNKLPYYLQKESIQRRKNQTVWGRLVGKTKWQANMGDTLKAVRKEPSPRVRQTAVPLPLSQRADKDIYGVNETTQTEVLRHKKHESNVFHFLPSFQDFLKDHVMANKDDLTDKMTDYDDLFIRTYIYQKSPRVFIPNRAAGETVDAPTGFYTGTYKTTAWLQGMINELTLSGQGQLSIEAVMRALNVMEDQLRVVPFSGGGQLGDNTGYNNDKYVLVTSGEWFNSLIDSDFVSGNKPLNMDLLFGPFKGSICGRITTKFESFPLRFTPEGVMHEPELIVADTAAENYGETVPNPDYTDPAISPIEVSWLVGGDGAGYKSLSVGAPPSEFAAKSMSQEKYSALNWNGEIKMTDNLLLTYDNGVVDTNSYGEYLRMQSYALHGIIGTQRRNVIPIFHVRKQPFSG